MPQLQANNVSLEYETFGDTAHPTVLLIMGLGTQMIAWPDPFCEMIAEKGFHVIRFDNRDVGLSQKFNHAPTPGAFMGLLRDIFGLRPRKLAYTLEDMADDAIGVLDALGITEAHVVGASMGGMIAQIASVRHAPRVLTLTSIMSSSGDRKMQKARLRVLKSLLFRRRPAPDAPREEHVDYMVHVWKTIGSPGEMLEEDRIRDMVTRATSRSIDVGGLSRQSAAIAASGCRHELLRQIDCPTLVLHGKEDVLLPPLAGFDTVMHVRGAKVEFIDDMGHDLPSPLWERTVQSIASHCHGVVHEERDVA